MYDQFVQKSVSSASGLINKSQYETDKQNLEKTDDISDSVGSP